MLTYRIASLLSGRGSVAAAIALQIALLLTVTGHAHAAAAGMIVSGAADMDDHLVRRCKLRSKAEFCYWEKIVARHTAEH